MNNFVTIISGVTIFVIGQFILKLVLEPIVEFKKSIGRLSEILLRNRDRLLHNQYDNKDVLELRQAVATVLACKQAIPIYRIVSKLVGLPSSNDILAGCFYLNAILEAVREDGEENKHLNHVGQCLGKAKNKFRIKLAL